MALIINHMSVPEWRENLTFYRSKANPETTAKTKFKVDAVDKAFEAVAPSLPWANLDEILLQFVAPLMAKSMLFTTLEGVGSGHLSSSLSTHLLMIFPFLNHSKRIKDRMILHFIVYYLQS